MYAMPRTYQSWHSLSGGKDLRHADEMDAASDVNSKQGDACP
jgi:hypothetical protein